MEMTLEILFNTVGGLSIFLYGMFRMSDSIQKLAGQKLRNIINTMTSNRIMGLGIGATITAVIQSSSITTVMVVGFVNANLMNLRQAIGIILGADIGTTITGWLLVLKIGKYGLPIAGIGIFIFLFYRSPRWKQRGNLILGIGLIFFGLELMKHGIKPLKDLPAFIELFQTFEASDFKGVVLSAIMGALLTAILQSSSATIGITMAMASQGLLSPNSAVALVLGENIGTTITAFLASLNGSSSARKAAYAHISIKIIGVSIIIPLFFFYVEFIGLIASPEENIIKYIAISHTLFNIFIALLFLPFTTKLEKLLNYLVPENKQNLNLEIDDDNLAQTPFIVLEKSKLLIFKMNDIYSQGFREFGTLMSDDSRKCNSCVEKLFEAERQLDEIKIIIINSLTSVLRHSDSNRSVLEVRHYLELADYYESLGDYEASLAKQYLQLKKEDFQFHPNRKKAILKIHSLISKINSEFPDLLKYPDNAKIKDLIKRSEHINEILQFNKKNENTMEIHIYFRIMEKLRRINRHLLFILRSVEKYNNF
jgi:phosphate:Na+ symporter